MKHPGRFLMVGCAFAIPVNVVLTVAELRYDLEADATFGLFSVLAVLAVFATARIVEGPFSKPPDRDEG